MVNAFNSNQEALESIGLDRIQTFDRPESDYSESWNKVREMHKIMSSPNSREYGLTKVLQPILDDVFEKTGKRFDACELPLFKHLGQRKHKYLY